MKIDQIETVRHTEFSNLTYVRVYTDDGLVGTGETFYGSAAVEAHVHSEVAPLLLGSDPLRIEAHSLQLQGYVGYGGSGVETRSRSAVDIALWDIRAQAAGMSLYDTMGGATRESIRIYNTCAGTQYVRHAGQSSRNWGLAAGTSQYEDLARFLTDAGSLAEELLSEGISAMKIWPFDTYAEESHGTSISNHDLNAALEPFRKIREAVGDSMEIMVEMHGLWNVPGARKIVGALHDFRPYWIEDPVRSDLRGGLEAVAPSIQAAQAMLATGETVAGLSSFLPMLSPGPVDVATVDLGWGGGITTALKVAAAAEAAGKAVAPHDCTGPIALTAATHFSISVPNALAQETVRAALRHWYGDIVTELPEVSQGAIRPPGGHGLGTALQPDFVSSGGAIVRTSTTKSGDS